MNDSKVGISTVCVVGSGQRAPVHSRVVEVSFSKEEGAKGTSA